MSLFGGAAWDESNVYDSVPFEEQLDAMDELRRSGKVRYFGLSNETSYGVMRFQQLHEASPATKEPRHPAPVRSAQPTFA